MRTTERFQTVRENTRKQLRKMKRKVFVVLAGFKHCRLCLFGKLRIKKTSLPVFISLLVKKKKSPTTASRVQIQGLGECFVFRKQKLLTWRHNLSKFPLSPERLSALMCVQKVKEQGCFSQLSPEKLTLWRWKAWDDALQVCVCVCVCVALCQTFSDRDRRVHDPVNYKPAARGLFDFGLV